MELISFSILFFIGIITFFTESNSFLKYIYIPFLLLFMLIVRLQAFYFDGFEIDIMTYATEMQSSLKLEGVYYIREFVFWFGIRLMYAITNSPFFSFLILDLLWIYILIRSTSHLSKKYLGRGVVILLSTSFPFLFGYENIYRQFYATVILLYAYSILDKSSFRSSFFFLVSFFTHNLMLFVLPIFIIKRCYKFNIADRTVLSCLLSFFYILILPFFLDLKSYDVTKFDLSLLYFLLFSFLFFLFIYKFRENVYVFIEKIPTLFPSFIIILGLYFIGEEMITERVSMILIIFLLNDFYIYSNEIKNKSSRLLLRIGLLFLFTLPVYVFESSLKFLL